MVTKKNTKSRGEKVKRVIDQVREPFSLLETLKEEGMASAMTLLGMASGAAKNLKTENLKPHVQELVQSLGFVMRADLTKLENRIEELEDRLARLEMHEHSEDE